MTTMLTRATAHILKAICNTTTTATTSPLLSSALVAQAACVLPKVPALMKCTVPVRRMSCCKQKCVRNPPPRCSKEEMKKTPCHESRNKCKDTSDPKCSPFKSMWENPECCRDPCPGDLPRFDELYYQASDKERRKYQQTWNECPELVVRKKPICCYEKICMPPFEKRPKTKCPQTACPPPDGSCKKKGDYRCPKTTMPCCGVARSPPKCHKVRKPSCCMKVCCPYPSYSECCRDRPRPRHPIECKCLRLLNTCEVFDYLRSRPWLLERPRY